MVFKSTERQDPEFMEPVFPSLCYKLLLCLVVNAVMRYVGAAVGAASASAKQQYMLCIYGILIYFNRLNFSCCLHRVWSDHIVRCS